MKLIMLAIVLGVFTATLQGQVRDDHVEETPRNHHLGFAGGAVYILKEKEFAPGVNLHYNYLFRIKNLNLGTGLGFEAILDRHTHYAANINLTYLPTHALSITAAPGLVFTENESAFSVHFETNYAFELEKIHIGPTVEVAVAKEDIHLMLGLHLGFEL